MEQKQRYCFMAFGELAVDITYDEYGVIKEDGGVSAFNTLYNLSVFGEETYAVGGVGADIKLLSAINSLRNSYVDTRHIQILNKPTNAFYIYKPQKDLLDESEIEIKRVSPITGKSSIEWSNEIHTDVPKEFEDRNVILIVSNFEPVTKEFIKNVKEKCSNSIISLDITNGKIFEKYSEKYILNYLKTINLLQCNEKTAEILCQKLNVSSPQEVFSKINAEVFTLTKGKEGAIFFYRSDGKIKIIEQKPRIVAPLVDPNGAGDAFHSMMLMSYCRMKYNNEKLDEKYFKNAFKVANALSRKVVQSEGARLKANELLACMIDELTEDKIKDGIEIE